ncbi:MAG: Lrp/AsnC ligand binding domain-containing protein [Paracoccus sp. (in: a-proteobacteria)]|uniref:Lrp/AsnC ligand binding domain-containing protein n=1 Tax=Paracoccus sp. TaxID=267 RepID=UPI0026E0CA53|nr:Lrp/AsnC ligand binding domain-containing protein [Paracoccus sp. (in: a-proteobacteria)]MDO5622135.1 Lrp/AsnC ligand binding domain-containing protein [Paracoccus sp. (in: a-proteobacteria)]
MRPVFVQIRCQPGQTYAVAEEIYSREVVSELYSTSGDYDLLAKVYIPEDQDTGLFLNGALFGIPGIARTLTTITFKTF